MKIIIDRFEGDIAVAEMPDGTIAEMPRIFLPEKAKEGSCVSITCDEEETENRRGAMKKKMDSLFHK